MIADHVLLFAKYIINSIRYTVLGFQLLRMIYKVKHIKENDDDKIFNLDLKSHTSSKNI